MRVFSVVGRSGSGKTTTIELLIKQFRCMGFSVGTVKDLKHTDYQTDIVGKNTFRHKAAGASPVTARADESTDIMFTRRLSMQELLRYYGNDLVILEGFRDFEVPQLLTGCDEMQLQEKYTKRVFAVSGVYAASHHQWQNLPCFNALCEVEQLCSFILQQVQEYAPELPQLFVGEKVLPLSLVVRQELSVLLGNKDVNLEYKTGGEKNED